MNPKRIVAVLILAAVSYMIFVCSYWAWTVEIPPPPYPGGPLSAEARGISYRSTLIGLADVVGFLCLTVWAVIWSFRTLSGSARRLP